jgi:hypothetical protein
MLKPPPGSGNRAALQALVREAHAEKKANYIGMFQFVA